MFADLSPNGITSAPTELTVAGDKLFFTAMPEMQPGHKLWVTDGTPQNTQVVSNVEASKLRAVNGKLFFIGTDSINGSELWTSDGTGAGTFLVADIRPGSASGINNQSLITGTDGNNMYFVAIDSLHGSELWKTTGVPGNAVLVKDIFPGIYASDIRGITGLNGLVLFTATDNLVGRELFISDGSFAGTNSITALRPTNLGSLFYYNLPIFQVFQDKLFFNANNGLNGEEPWSSDGTTTGTALLLDIYSGLESSDPFFKAATASDLFFSANSAGFGREIWKTNGTTQGTVLLKDINPGPDGCSTEDIAALGDKIVFTAYRPAEQEEMWSSDGTEAGTNLLKDIAPGGPSQPRLLPQAFSLSGLPTALFSARPDSLSKGTLWKTDGSPSGTVELWSPDSSSIFTLNEAIQWGTEVLFTGFFPNGDVALYKTDGTSGGTGLVKAISTGLANGGQSQFTVFKNQVFFSANDGISGRELWRTDGTGPGTYRLNDLAGGNAGSYPMAFYNFKDTLLFFSATDEGYNSELWSTTGNAGDTHLVKDIRPGYQSSNLYDFVSYQGKVYFSADDGLHGRELWQTDGSLAGTTMVKDINPGLASSVPTDLTVFNDHIYFAADDGVHGRELWRFPEDSSSSTQAPVATGLTIYPNPVAQFLTLQLDSGGTRDVLVYDIAGRLAERFIVPGSGQQRLDVGRLSTGFYTLICTDQESHARLFARVQIVR